MVPVKSPVTICAFTSDLEAACSSITSRFGGPMASLNFFKVEASIVSLHWIEGRGESPNGS
jgi:hypothetical protein